MCESRRRDKEFIPAVVIESVVGVRKFDLYQKERSVAWTIGPVTVGAHLSGLDQRCHVLDASENIDDSGRCIKNPAEFEFFGFNSPAVRRKSLPVPA